MTTVAKYTALPIVTIVVITGIMMFLYSLITPSLKLSGSTSVSTVKATELDLETIGVYSMHSSKGHDPYLKGGVGEKMVRDIVSNWPGKPDGKNWRCATIFIGKEVLRTLFWHSTGGGAGNLAWFNHETGLWGGGYDQALESTFHKLPYDIKDVKSNPRFKGAKIQGGCDDKNFPGGKMAAAP